MPRETRPQPPVTARAAALNRRYRDQPAFSVLARALSDGDTGRVALVSSFGAESVALLHMLALLDPARPVLFLDTEMLFAETLAYQREVAETLGLRDVRVIRADRTRLAAQDPDASLHRSDPDACCALRKSGPLERALAPFDAWISGRKRYQSGRRAALDVVEAEAAGRIKINPLAHWTREDVAAYIVDNRLPRHPLVARGYPSLGCAPCTTPVAPGEDVRAGRWRGAAKEECGIHVVDGRIVRGPARQAS